MWNSQPLNAVEAKSVNVFKKEIDRLVCTGENGDAQRTGYYIPAPFPMTLTAAAIHVGDVGTQQRC